MSRIPYLWVQNFSGGLDKTRNRMALPDNSLVDLVNAVITRGGDIQQQKAWVQFAEVSRNTFGIRDKGGSLYVFGSAPAGSVTVGSGVSYQRLLHPDDPTGVTLTMTSVLSSGLFRDKLYVVAQFSDGNIFHYHGGVLVDQLSEGIVRAVTSNAGLAARLAPIIDAHETYIASNSGSQITIYRTDGEDFDILDDSEGAADNGQEISYEKETIYSGGAGDEVRASVTLSLFAGGSGGTVAAVKVDGTAITENAVAWDTDIATTLDALCTEIRNNGGGYSASYSGSDITIKAPVGRGSRANGAAISMEVTGAMAFNPGYVQIVDERTLSSNFTFSASEKSIVDNSVLGILGNLTGSLVVSGSASNDGTYTILSNAGADKLYVSESLSDETVDCTITEVNDGKYVSYIEVSDSFSLNRPVLVSNAAWDTDPETTADAVADYMSDENYTFFSSGDKVWCASPNITASFPEGHLSSAGTLLLNIQDIDTTFTTFSGGVDGIPLPRTEITLSIDGIWATGDYFGVSLVYGEVVDVFGCGDIKTPVPGIIQAYGDKVYALSENSILFSAIADATVWQPLQTDSEGATLGAGNITLTTAKGYSDAATAIEPFLNFLAIGFPDEFQLWDMDNDPVLNELIQQPQNIGTRFPNALISYGDVDAFLLSESGVRSLRSVNSTNTVNVMDPGLAIDEIIIPAVKNAENIFAVIEPEDNRYILFIDDECFPFSLFYGADIQGWSRFSLPFTAKDVTKSKGTLAVRGRLGSGNDVIYYYGGEDGDTYTGDAEVTIVTPFFTTDDPINNKQWVYLEFLAEGTWTIECAVTYKGVGNEPVWKYIGTFTNTTFMLNNISMEVAGTAIALRLKSSSAKSRMSQIGINFKTDGSAQNGL